jgi:two-component system, OmpR family, phosphate regulon sensor histidine kinase PhoR
MKRLSIFGRDALNEAVRALQTELEGGPRAELDPEVNDLAALLAEREARGLSAEREHPERELLAAIPDAAALVGRDGRIRLANTACEALSPSGRAAGLTVLELTRSAELADAVRRALEGTGRRLEIALGRRSFLAQLTPLLRGEVLFLLRDVTDTRRADATRRDFVANASHELRTPIAAIAGAAETLLSGAIEEPEQARPFVDIISRQAERLTALTRDLLDLSRIEGGQWTIELGPVDLEALARRALDLFGGTVAKKRIALRSQVPAGLSAWADARALEQVLVNLLDNAVKYTPEGGSVALSAECSGSRVVLAVTDTGPGIERHHLPRIFERFYRADAGRSREMGGTGLGLAIVKHLVQAMRGDVGVESGSGGSRFWVHLPTAG